APSAVAAALTPTWPPDGTASSALASRLSRICSRWPSPRLARTGPGHAVVSATPRSSAIGRQAAARSASTVSTATPTGRPPRLPRRGPRRRAAPEGGQRGAPARRGGQLGGGGLSGVLGKQAQPQRERGEGGTELMGDVGHHGLVAVDQRLEPSRHDVERE